MKTALDVMFLLLVAGAAAYLIAERRGHDLAGRLVLRIRHLRRRRSDRRWKTRLDELLREELQ